MTITAHTYLQPAPPLMIGAALLLWGWQSENLALSVAMGLILESSRWHAWKIDLDSRDFNRITDFTSLLMVIVIAWLFYNYGTPGIFEILASLPLLLYPLIFAQMHSSLGSVYSSNLFISIRKLKDVDPWYTDNRINLDIPYFIVCIVAASEGNHHQDIFFTVICILVAWLLWHLRSRRYQPVVFLLMLVLATGTAFQGQKGLRILQQRLESSYIEFFNRFHSLNRDTHRQTTAIGSLGILKLSDRIVLRVDPSHKLNQPLFLAEASYNYYAYGTWANISQKTHVIDPELNGTSWLLHRPDDGRETVRITAYFEEEEAILPLPQGTTGIHEFPAFQLERVNTDSFRAELKPGWTSWEVNYDQHRLPSLAPDSADLHIGTTYRDEIKVLSNQLGLHLQSEKEVIDTVERFFHDNFRYSLIQKHRYPRGKYLTKFLFDDRKGHCEYFATATVLLLRTAGIPARYVVGYVVDEYSPFEGKYIARARHAHSWVMAFVDGHWIRVDTTPSIWAELEGENQSSFQFMGDLWSWLRLKADEIGESEFMKKLDVTWIAAGLFMILVILVYRRKKSQSKDEHRELTAREIRIYGKDSPLLDYVRQLEAQGYHRLPGETLEDWFQRLAKTRPELADDEIIRIHNDYRFNPDSTVRPEDIERMLRTRLPDLEHEGVGVT